MYIKMGFPGGTSKETACQCRRRKSDGFAPWVRKIPWRRKWQPTPVILPRESHGRRSLVGYNPWGCKKLDMIEATQQRPRKRLLASQRPERVLTSVFSGPIMFLMSRHLRMSSWRSAPTFTLNL